MYNRVKKRKFTLTEVIVSMAIFSILMVIILQFFSGVQNLWKNSASKNSMHSDARVAMSLIANSLMAIANDSVLPQTDFYYNTTSSTNKEFDEITFATRNPLGKITYTGSSSTQNNEMTIVTFGLGNNGSFDATVNSEDKTDLLIQLTSFGDIGNASRDNDTGRYIISSGNKSDEKLIGNIIELKFRAIDPDTTNGWNDGDHTPPPAIEITMSLLPASVLEKWKELSGTARDDLEQEHKFTFKRLVYLGNY